MIFITHIHKYTQTRNKIGTETRVIEASCIEDWYKKSMSDLHLVPHDLHFCRRYRDDNYLYRIKLAKQYKTEMEYNYEQSN